MEIKFSAYDFARQGIDPDTDPLSAGAKKITELMNGELRRTYISSRNGKAYDSLLEERNIRSGFNVDSDINYFNDVVSLATVMDYPALASYFESFINVFQLNMTFASVVDEKYYVKLFNDLYYADGILTPKHNWEEMIRPTFERLFSQEMIHRLEEKMHYQILPGYYKLGEWEKDNHREGKITLLWNHRLKGYKNFPVFVKMLKEYVSKYGEEGIEVLITASESKAPATYRQEKSIHNICKFIGLKSGDEYTKLLKETDVQVVTAEDENFGISLQESVKYGHAMLGWENSKVFTRFFGHTYTKNISEMADYLKLLKDSVSERVDNNQFHRIMQDEIFPTSEEYVADLKEWFQTLIDKKFNKAPKKGKINDLIQTVREKKFITKKDLMSSIGFNNQTYWGRYYYGLRKEGVNVFESRGESVFTFENSLNGYKSEKRRSFI